MTKVGSFHTVLMSFYILNCFDSFGQIKYPVARKEVFDTVIYNKKLSDEYARLQNKQLSERPILFMVDWEGGHADAGTSRADRIRKWKFLLWQTGHPYFQLKK